MQSNLASVVPYINVKRQSTSAASIGRFPTVKVYYILGLPRSGSTFVGDWLARHLNAVNAGETWQTFRTAGLVLDPAFERGGGKWFRSELRDRKIEQIAANAFWAPIIASAPDAPYPLFVEHARKWSDIIVDCSKVDRALPHYLALGCEVHVVHVVRAFSSWSCSMNKHRARDGRPAWSRLRMLGAYVRANRAGARWRKRLSYRRFFHEDLGEIEQRLGAEFFGSTHRGSYLRAEMFGTPDFTPHYDIDRAAISVTAFDKLLFQLAGVGS